MITCNLNGKKYHVDFISGRALREMEPAAKMYGKIHHSGSNGCDDQVVLHPLPESVYP